VGGRGGGEASRHHTCRQRHALLLAFKPHREPLINASAVKVLPANFFRSATWALVSQGVWINTGEERDCRRTPRQSWPGGRGGAGVAQGEQTRKGV